MGIVRRILFIVLLLAAVGFVFYTQVLRPISVIGHKVESRELVVEVMGTGTVQARISTVISPKIQGRLIELGVDQGDRVTAGQIIARLDNSDVIRQVEIAQANSEAATAGLDRLRANESRAQAVLRQVEREINRIRKAFEQGAANESELDKAQEQVAIAQADLASTKAGVAEGRMLRIAAEKTLEYHGALLEDTVIKAPFDGLIVRRERDEGSIVVPGSGIYSLISLDEIWLSAWVDETAMASLSPDQPARVVLRSQPNDPFTGHVVRLGRETDPETREFIVDVVIEQLPTHWAIGQRGEVYIETARLNGVLTVPMNFVKMVEGNRGVYVLRKGHASWTPCTFGAQGRDSIEVAEGINAGDTILRTPKQGALRDQKKVVIQ
ncbi:MAG: efflux RND transporter periplasmic adaptor subunit [Phycisphaerales bacterium]|nr:efflux RND transporter periplasmic adaptor subunit [Phycisphaerales bacterium]